MNNKSIWSFPALVFVQWRLCCPVKVGATVGGGHAHLSSLGLGSKESDSPGSASGSIPLTAWEQSL